MKNRTLLIGIAGASGSGKSCFAEKLRSQLGESRVIILSQDFYYKERSDVPFEARQRFNYDHPDAIDFELLVKQLFTLKSGSAIEHPMYDFAQHNRRPEIRSVGPAEVVLVDGILIYAVEACRQLFDYRLFIDTPLDLCFIRRLRRDLRERGRSVESVVEQYLTTVRPMYLEFVEPTRALADRVISGACDFAAEIEAVAGIVKRMSVR